MVERNRRGRPWSRAGVSLLLGAVCLLVAGWLEAGWTDEALHVQGPSIGLYNGDYVSESAGLDTYYAFWIEVPPGTGELRIYLYDADIGGGGSSEALDLTNSNATAVRYTLIDPTGAVFTTVNLPFGACSTCDDAWAYIGGPSSPMPGHWEFRIDQSTGVQSGGGPWDDINVVWLAPYDPVNGVELNLYARSYTAMGNVMGGGTVTYDLFPWVVCGCEADSNDFDADASATGTTMTISTRSGATTWSPTASGATTWANNTLGGFTTDSDSIDYGIWHVAYDLTTTSSFPYNWGTYEFGNWDAADPAGSGPPPSAQPEANTARLYFTTLDGGGADPPEAPAKEYLEQMVRYRSGPTPPQTGQTTVVTVTVRVANPTAYPIEFSSNQTITSWVPGGDAVYHGNLQLGQGTVISQPALGGSGNVVWNPGTVAAGSTVIMAYEVAVTPSASGQRVPVTGWPGNHGTTATYVDGTCAGAGCSGTQLDSATATMGPLCGLAITENQVTHAVITAFRLLDDGGESVVEWETGSEEGTLGYRLLRDDRGRRVPVLAAAVPALWNAARGGTYRVRSSAIGRESRSTFWLEELEAGGKRILHGPYTPSVEPMPRGSQGEWPSRNREWERHPHDVVPAPDPIHRPSGTSMDTRGSALAVGIRGRGMALIPAEFLARGTGQTEGTIRRLIRWGRIRLTHKGQPVAWKAAPHGAGLIFFAPGLDSLYTNEDVFVLSVSSRSGSIPSRYAAAFPPSYGGTFSSSIHAEEDHLAATVLGLDPESDYWFWTGLIAGDPVMNHCALPLDAPNPSSGEASLTLRFQGASDTEGGRHEARVLLNGTELGTATWQGLTTHEATFSFDGTLLARGRTNTVTVEARATSSFSAFFIDSMDLRYRRTYRVDHDALFFDVAEPGAVTLEGPGTAALQLFNVTDESQPVELQGARSGSAFTADLTPGRYVAVPDGGFLQPASLRAVSEEDPLRRPATYLVVSPQALRDGANRLAEHREKRGLTAAVVTVEEIMDRYNGSIFDPHAIQRFLEEAYRSWDTPPRFVVLLGTGSFDYRGLLGPGRPGVPPLLLKTPQGLYAADGLFTDFDGDGVPEIPVGRLPFTDRDILEKWLHHAEIWETRALPPTLLAISDDREGAADFTDDAAYVTGVLPRGFSRTWSGLDRDDLTTVRATLFRSLEGGVSLVQYFGHGGSDRWADEGILTVDDLDGSHAFGVPPFVTALTCAVNRFEIPGYSCLGERLLDPGDGGAVAVWSPSGLTSRADLRKLGRALEGALVLPGGTTLGEALREALSVFPAGTDGTTCRLLFNLLGDPALPVRFDCPGGESSPDLPGATSGSFSPPIPLPDDVTHARPVDPAR